MHLLLISIKAFCIRKYNGKQNMCKVRLEVLIAVLMNIQVFLDVMLSCWVHSSWHVKGLGCLCVHSQAIQEDCLMLKACNLPNMKMCALERETINGEYEEWYLAWNFATVSWKVLRVVLMMIPVFQDLHHVNRPNTQNRVTCLVLLDPGDRRIIVLQNIGVSIYQLTRHNISEDTTLQICL